MPPRRNNLQAANVVLQLPCEQPGCNRWFKTPGGRTKHRLAAHPTMHQPCRSLSPPPPLSPSTHPHPPPRSSQVENGDHCNPTHQRHEELRMGGTLRRVFHPRLNGNVVLSVYYLTGYQRILISSGQPCDAYGNLLPPDAPPPPLRTASNDDWTPYTNRTQFETADLLYRRTEMSAKQIDALMDIWAATLIEVDPENPERKMPPFTGAKHLYDVIDNTPLAGTKWSKFSVKYSGDRQSSDRPPWMDQMFDVWFRDPLTCIRTMLKNPDFKDSFDYRPYQEHCLDNNERRYQDFMSGDWVWIHAVS